MARIGVFGIGNVLMGDDAVGPYAVRVFEAQYEVPDEVPKASPRYCAPTLAMKSVEFMPSLSRNFWAPPPEIQARAMVAPSTG